jgi:hypothetical protein
MSRVAAGAIAAFLAVQAAPAAADNPSYWHHAGRTLAFVPDESDAFSLELRCTKTHRLVLSSPAIGAEKRRRVLELKSGSLQRSYPAKLHPEDENYGPSVEAIVPLDDPIISRFRATKRLIRQAEDLSSKSAAESKAIDDFFRQCARL